MSEAVDVMYSWVNLCKFFDVSFEDRNAYFDHVNMLADIALEKIKSEDFDGEIYEEVQRVAMEDSWCEDHHAHTLITLNLSTNRFNVFDIEGLPENISPTSAAYWAMLGDIHDRVNYVLGLNT